MINASEVGQMCFTKLRGGSLWHKNFPSVGVRPNFELENGEIFEIDINRLMQFEVKSDASLIGLKLCQTKHSFFFNFKDLSKEKDLMIMEMR